MHAGLWIIGVIDNITDVTYVVIEMTLVVELRHHAIPRTPADTGRLPPEYAEEARKWALMRATDEDLARHFEIPLETLHEWRAAVPEFAKAVRYGRKMGDADVVDRFHQNCLGFSHEAEKIFRPLAAGEEPVRATYTKHYPPNTSAGKFWLVNRLPGEWRMKVEIEAKLSHGNATASPDPSSTDELLKSLNSLLLEDRRRRDIQEDCLAWCRLLGHEPAAHHRLIVRELCTLMEQTRLRHAADLRPAGLGQVAPRQRRLPGVVAGAPSQGQRARRLAQCRAGGQVGPPRAQPDPAAFERARDRPGGRQPGRRALGAQERRRVPGGGRAGRHRRLPRRSRHHRRSLRQPRGRLQRARPRSRVGLVHQRLLGPPETRRQARRHAHALAHGRPCRPHPRAGARPTGTVRVVSLPAIAEKDDILGRQPGEYLWDEPEGYDYASFLKRRQVETPPMEWAALYQQQPVPESGDYFKARLDPLLRHAAG